MAELLTRFSPDLEVRSGGDGRHVYGLLVPYGPVADVADAGGRPYRERFVMGAFRRTIVERGSRVKLLVAHDHRRLPIGKFTSLTEDAAGLVGEARVSQTAAGDEALELVRDGTVDAFSIGFAPVRDRVADDGVLERTEVALREASLVGLPAYEDALVAGVRTAVPVLSAEAARARLTLLDLESR